MNLNRGWDRPFLNWLIKNARQLGCQPDAISEQLLQSMRRNSKARAEQELFNNFLELLSVFEDQAADSHIGLHLGERMIFSEIGLYGYVLLCATTVEDFLKLIERYESLLVSVKSPEFVSGAETSTLYQGATCFTTSSQKHEIDLNLGAYTTAIRNYLDQKDWSPVRAGFAYPQPDNVNEHRRVFGEELAFDEPRSYIEIQNHVLRFKIRDSEPELLQIVINQADQQIQKSQESGQIAPQVKAELVTSIGHRSLTQEEVAANLYMSRSSLQRRLAEEGTSFRVLKDEVIYQFAIQALHDTRTSIAQIALILGYSETSAFDRAFARLSDGKTPMQYRRNLQK